MPSTYQFILNGKDVRAPVSAGTLLLDYLRQKQKLVGVKEGCKEGDCGACTILVGAFEDEKVSYRPLTSCLIPVAEMHGKHVVTVEGLNLQRLSPVQQAIVDAGASQCGFCTPGIVISMTSLLMRDDAQINKNSVKEVLSGHLCRCTGYRSLKSAAGLLADIVGERTGIKALADNGMLPDYFLEIPDRLRRISPFVDVNGKKAASIFIAGGTDLYVQMGETIPETNIVALNVHPEMKAISREKNRIRIGALCSFEDFARHEEIIKIAPEIEQYMFLIASLQIRHRATLGGNIINASPIGDMTILLMALQAHLVFENGRRRRELPLTSLYRGYKKLDKSPAEILTEIVIPVPASDAKIHFEKVSRRKTLDIASVNSAIRIREKNGMIDEIALAFGGVAPIPLYMKKTSQYLIGKPLSVETVIRAMPVAQDEISPISDIRGSATYKRLLVRQLMIAHFSKLFPNRINAEAFYETY